MKQARTLVLIILAVMCLSDMVQAQKLPALDPSPADISYLRQNGRNSEAVAKVIYGRPSKKGRTMLGGVEPFGKTWRLGANETTEIKLFKDITFGDKLIKAGTYSLYAVPDKSEWTLIFNSKLDTWGAYEYDEKKDVARIKVPAGKSDAEIEAFTIAFDGKDGSGTMAIGWENTLVKVPVKW